MVGWTDGKWLSLSSCLLMVAWTVGCQPSESTEDTGATGGDTGDAACTAGDEELCECPEGGAGTRSCQSDGTWSGCDCADAADTEPGSRDATDGGAPGDGGAETGESATNLLENPGFEQGEPGDECPPEWTCVTYQPSDAGTFSVVDDAAHRGEASVHWAAGMEAGPVVKQRVDAAPGQRYRISAWVRGEGLDSEPFVQILFDDANEDLLDDQTFRPDGETDEWVEITGVTRSAPTGTDTLRFNLAVDGTDGPVWWDAAGLQTEDEEEEQDAGMDAGQDTGTDSGSGEAPPEHERIGGGSAYVEYLEHLGEPTFCDPSSGDEVVGQASVDALEDALARADSGDVVYVEGGLEIDMGFDASIDIPSGVTLASNRGCDGAEGAHLYTDDKPDEKYTPRQMFEPTHDDVRVTGLRLEGPYQTSDELHPLTRSTNLGIEPDAVEGLEIDNVEMFNFMWAAIRAGDSVVHLHHSDIHHNNQNGLGYGITATDWKSVIEYNRFDYNRHAIAGGGEPSEGYVARYNVFGDSCLNSQQRMDQHGHPNDGDTAGHKMEIYRNTVLDPDCTAVSIRGEPEQTTPIRHNWFEPSEGQALSLGADNNLGKGHPKFDVHDNHYGGSEPSCDIGAPRASCE